MNIYLDGVGVARVRGAGGRVVDGVSCVAARLVGREPEQGPVALLEPERVPLGAGEVVLALHGQAPQGLGVQPPQLGVDALPVVDVAQEGLQLQAGPHVRRQARFGGREGSVELRRGRAGDAGPAVDAQAAGGLQGLVQRPGPGGPGLQAVAMLQRLVGGEHRAHVDGAGRQTGPGGHVGGPAHVALRTGERETRVRRDEGSPVGVGSRHRAVDQFLLGQRRRLDGRAAEGRRVRRTRSRSGWTPGERRGAGQSGSIPGTWQGRQRVTALVDCVSDSVTSGSQTEEVCAGA